MKHSNTKQDVKTKLRCHNPSVQSVMIGLKTKAEFEKHKEEHMEEIERLDISTLINGHDLFACNLCSFESGHGESIKEHLVDHVNHTNELARHKKKSLLDDYDDDGNYVGDDPNWMDSDDESETDNEN